jgi:peptidoglycan/LPS O-acetylase OafA/YrhL
MTSQKQADSSRKRGRSIPIQQRTTILYGVLCFVLLVVIVQLWLLSATMHAYLDGDTSLILPGVIASVICLLLNLGLLRYLYRLER